MNLTKGKIQKVKKSKHQTKKNGKKRIKKKRIVKSKRKNPRKYNLRKKTLKGGYGVFNFKNLFWPKKDGLQIDLVKTELKSLKKKPKTPKNIQNVKQLEYLVKEGSTLSRDAALKKWTEMSKVLGVPKGEDPLSKMKTKEEEEQEEIKKDVKKSKDLIAKKKAPEEFPSLEDQINEAIFKRQQKKNKELLELDKKTEMTNEELFGGPKKEEEGENKNLDTTDEDELLKTPKQPVDKTMSRQSVDSSKNDLT